MKRKIIAVCVTCMTVLAMTACGNASQAATSTQTSTSAQVVKSEAQKVTTPATATKAPETTKAEETLSNEGDNGIDYSTYKAGKYKWVKEEDYDSIIFYIKNFGEKEVKNGETIDLSDYEGWNSLSDEVKSFLLVGIRGSFGDYISDMSTTIAVNNEKDIFLCFKLDTKIGELSIMKKKN